MSTILRKAATVVQASCTRTFASSALARKDIVQDSYIREIKGYKPIPSAKDAHVGVVKKLSLPPSPRMPTLPTNLAAELAAYDATEPTVATPAATAATTTTASSEEGAAGAEAFLTFLEQDLPKPEHHHH